MATQWQTTKEGHALPIHTCESWSGNECLRTPDALEQLLRTDVWWACGVKHCCLLQTCLKKWCLWLFIMPCVGLRTEKPRLSMVRWADFERPLSSWTGKYIVKVTLRTPWSWQNCCLNHCARTCCSLRNVTRCRFTNWRIRCERGGRNVHFLSINLISFRRSHGIVLVLNSACFEVGLIRTVIDNVTGSQRAA